MSGRLAGLGVVVTRPRPAAEALAAALEREGAQAFVFPALAIEELPASPALEAALAQLERASLAVFASPTAVEKGLAAARRAGTWPKAAVAAVGQATAAALREAGFAQVIFPRGREDSEALAGLPELQADRVSGENIVVFRGEGGREALRRELEARGAKVAFAECYRRVRPASDPRPLLAAWARGEVHAVSVLSGETLENFVALLGTEGAALPGGVALVVPHEAVGAHREARRFARVVVAEPGIEGMTQALSRLKVTP